MDEIVYGDEPVVTKRLAESIEEIKKLPGYDAVASRAVLDTISELHSEWIKTRCEYNMPEEVRETLGDDCYLLAPIELTGWDMAEKYVALLRPVMEEVGMQIDDAAIRKEYELRTLAMLSRCDKDNPQFAQDENGCVYKASYDSLAELIISECGYQGNNPQLTNDALVEEVIVQGLMERGFGKDEELMRLVEASGIGFEPNSPGFDAPDGLDTPGNR